MKTNATSWFIILAAALTTLSAVTKPNVLTVIAAAVTAAACIVSLVGGRSARQ